MVKKILIGILIALMVLMGGIAGYAYLKWDEIVYSQRLSEYIGSVSVKSKSLKNTGYKCANFGNPEDCTLDAFQFNGTFPFSTGVILAIVTYAQYCLESCEDKTNVIDFNRRLVAEINLEETWAYQEMKKNPKASKQKSFQMEKKLYDELLVKLRENTLKPSKVPPTEESERKNKLLIQAIDEKLSQFRSYKG